jgi:hypothetical protein
MLRIAKEALTFDDVLLVPAHSIVLPNTADLRTHLTKDIVLNIPMAFLNDPKNSLTASGHTDPKPEAPEKEDTAHEEN